MKLLYNIGVRAYSLSVLTAGIFGNRKAVDWVEGRKNWMDYIKRFNDAIKGRPVLWIHASSLGEFEQVKPFIEEFKSREEYREFVVLVTFFSPSGFNYAKDYELADGMMYLPLDTKKNAHYFIQALKPKIAVFVKYDFWFNFLRQLQKSNIPTIYFSSKFRHGQFYFKKGMEWQLSIMKKIDVIQTQDKKSLELLIQKGFNNAEIGGDTRFDKVWQNKDRFSEIEQIKLFKQGCSLLALGSSWPPEESITAAVQDEILKIGYKICIAPHDISVDHIKQIQDQFPNHLLYSEITNETNFARHSILIIDNIGMLKSLYYYSDIAFVGGGFSNKLHNILEPAVFSNVILFGNDHNKFPEAEELMQREGAFEISSGAELLSFIENVLIEEDELPRLQEKSFGYIESNRGATEKLLSVVDRFLEKVK